MVHCDVPLEGVFTVPTVSSIYEVPLLLEKQGIPQLITDSLNLISDEKSITLSLNGWGQLVERIKTPKENLKIGLVGKYVDLHDAYMSVKEALIHAGLFHSLNIDIDWIAAEEIEKNGPDQFLKDLQGIVIPGGFGDRGIEGMVSAVQYARENKIPYLGLCLGMQVMVIEADRNLLGKKSANSQEFDVNTPDPVIHLMEDQVDVTQKGGTMRLGVYPCVIQSDSLTSRAYDESLVMERHRHRYEVNNDYREGLLEVGLKPTGLSPDGNLVEIMEIEDHPFMAGTQFHPEFLSRPVRPHPMFREFVGKSYEVAKKSAL